MKEVNIYIRADRTASERKEFDRLNKKKKELEKSFEPEEGDDDNEPRVKLARGSLTVDGKVVDRYITPQSLFWEMNSKMMWVWKR